MRGLSGWPIQNPTSEYAEQYLRCGFLCQLWSLIVVNVAADWVGHVARLLFPPTCVICADPGRSHDLDLCAGCLGALPDLHVACEQCAEPLVAIEGGARCGACLQRAPDFDASYCAYRYSFPVDHLIRSLKYHGHLAHARVLGTLLARHLQSAHRGPWPDVIIPTPLATPRFRERGFNQSIEIGREVAAALGIPLRADLVTRARSTVVQTGLDKQARRKNLRRAFIVRGAVPATVAILDDVITTGSTANEMAVALRRAGAQRVEVWAVARAVR